MKVLLFSLVVTERGIKDLCFLFLDEYLSINLPTELQAIATINRAKINLTVFISGLSVQKCEFKPITPCFIDRCQVHFLFYTCCKDHVVTRHIMLGYRQHTPLNDLRNVLLLTTWLKSNGFSSWVTILILQPEGRNFFAMPEGCKNIISRDLKIHCTWVRWSAIVHYLLFKTSKELKKYIVRTTNLL